MKKVYDELGREIPTFKQLGITPEIEAREMEKGGESFDRYYLAKREAWQLVNERKKAQRLSAKNVSNLERERLHWYNSLPDSKKTELISRAVSKKGELFETFLVTLDGNSPLFMYYFDLTDRVFMDNLSLNPIPYNKLKKFPDYDIHNDKLSGSIHSIMLLFRTCFPPIKRLKKRINL
jgi:hypothetical protein